jgi:hypothetical protein
MSVPIQKSHGIGGLVIGGIISFCGFLIIILGAVLGGKGDGGATLGPWWAGLMFMIPGILGIVSGVTKNKCAMISFLVLCIIIFIVEAIITGLMGIIVAILGVFNEYANDCTKVNSNTCKCNHNGSTFTLNGVDGDCDVIKDIYSLAAGVLAMMIIGCIACLAGSILGCVAVCCKNSAPAATTVIIQQGQGGNGTQQNPPPYHQNEAVKY